MDIYKSNEILNLAYMEPKSSSSLIENDKELDTSMWLVNDEEVDMDDFYLETTISSSSHQSIPRHAPIDSSKHYNHPSETVTTDSSSSVLTSPNSFDDSHLLNENPAISSTNYDNEIKNEPIEYRKTSTIHNNTSIKPPTCRSLYKYLVKTVSKRLGHKKQSATSANVHMTEIKPEESHTPIKVYAYNHKRASHRLASRANINTSTTTVAYLMHRRSNFFAGQLPQQPRDFVSPLGMKNFEWNRLNCGEFFSYDV